MWNRLLLAHAAAALVCGQALAQEVRLYRQNDKVDPREVASILGKGAAGQPPVKMRSIRLLDDAPSGSSSASASATSSAAAAAYGEPAPRPRTSALALPVQFAFDSADLLPSARPQLDALAEGIRLLPELQTVVIEGHTDALGSDHYNDQLSHRRAYAVKRYLVSQHNINPARLKAVGMGEYALLPGRDPYGSDNRRVQFRGE
jgi:outer membrane protein OmpA-like peptidoglycan-associated protein